jgi:hypothetical protein
MTMIRIGDNLFVNTEALAFVRADTGIDGKPKARLCFAGGTELLLTGAQASAVLGHVEALSLEPTPAPGLAVPAGEEYP